jgi:hypothetical protein
MEEKRSIHSMRSAAGRAHASQAMNDRHQRPMSSDISYIDEEGNITSNNGLRATGRPAHRQQQHVEQYLKVEGQTYRVQRVLHVAKQQQNQPQPTTLVANPTNRVRRCSDAQTQSFESSFDALTAQQPTTLLTTSSTSPTTAAVSTTTTNNSYQQRQSHCNAVDINSCVQQVGQASFVPPSSSSSRGPSPIPTALLVTAAPPSPSPIIQAAYGYDPSYCQYLGQAADGYQYELVRRPSLGNPLAAVTPAPNPELYVPQPPNHVLRRPSTGSPYPPPSHSPQPPPMLSSHQYSFAQTSMHGSFDSCAAGPPTPVAPTLLIQNPVSVSSSPFHAQQVLYQPQPMRFTQQHQQFLPPSRQYQMQISPRHPNQPGGTASAFRVVGDHVETTTASSEMSMPKMIHETSI